jgi:hypothetical protein
MTNQRGQAVAFDLPACDVDWKVFEPGLKTFLKQRRQLQPQ